MSALAAATPTMGQGYPGKLPDSELGVKYARYMCRTLAFFQSVEHREKWLERYAPWMGDEDRSHTAGQVPTGIRENPWGQHLELYDEDRERLKAWMIEAVDVTKEQRAAINRDKHRKVRSVLGAGTAPSPGRSISPSMPRAVRNRGKHSGWAEPSTTTWAYTSPKMPDRSVTTFSTIATRSLGLVRKRSEPCQAYRKAGRIVRTKSSAETGMLGSGRRRI